MTITVQIQAVLGLAIGLVGPGEVVIIIGLIVVRVDF